MQATVSTSVPVRLREAAFDDYPRIASLEAQYGLHPRGRKEWMHFWTGNPVYHAVSDWPIGWVCETTDNEIVASVANIPLRCELSGQTLAAATSRSLVADLRYRSYACALMKQFFNQKKVALFLNTTVSAQAAKLQELFRAKRVPAGTWDRSAFAIADYNAFSSGFLARNRNLPARTLLTSALSAGLYFKDLLTGRYPGLQCNSGVDLQICDRFDDRFEVFWQQLRTQQFGRLLACRSREVLDWHFGAALAKNEAWVVTVTKGTKLLAFAIFRRQDNAALGLKRMRLADFQVLDNHMELLKPMLLSALRRCRQEGIHMLEAIGFSAVKQRVVASVLPYSRQLGSWRYFYRAASEQLDRILQNAYAWDPTCFDGDASL